MTDPVRVVQMLSSVGQMNECDFMDRSLGEGEGQWLSNPLKNGGRGEQRGGLKNQTFAGKVRANRVNLQPGGI
jgi:hypothetical protein